MAGFKTTYTVQIDAECASCGKKDSNVTVTQFQNEVHCAKAPAGFQHLFDADVLLCNDCVGGASLVTRKFSIPLVRRR